MNKEQVQKNKEFLKEYYSSHKWEAFKVKYRDSGPRKVYEYTYRD